MRWMKIFNVAALEQAWRRHPQTKAWLQGWLEVAELADWHSLQELRQRFPAADGVRVPSGAIVTVFNVGGRDFRLLTTILYAQQRVYIWQVLTHAEYSKEKWKRQL
jgi:mRNA interferase HigB